MIGYLKLQRYQHRDLGRTGEMSEGDVVDQERQHKDQAIESFDVFETLLVRAVTPPAAVFPESFRLSRLHSVLPASGRKSASTRQQLIMALLTIFILS
jgi:hypothetical protein